MKIALAGKLTALLLKKMKAKGITNVLFVKLDQGVEVVAEREGIKLESIYENLTDAGNFSFDLVVEKLKTLKELEPSLFSSKGVDITHALEKDVFWGYYEKGIMGYHLRSYENKGAKVYDYYSRPKPVQFLALCKKMWTGSGHTYSFILPEQSSNDTRGKIAFRINDTEIIYYYGHLFRKLPREKLISFQSAADPRKINGKTIDAYFSFNLRSEARSGARKRLPLRSALRLLTHSADFDFMNVVIDAHYRMVNHVAQYSRLMEHGISKILVPAGENEGEGNVICELAKKFNVTTYNYMNGTKAYEKQNKYTGFDYWFMPDADTKELIMSYCDVTDRQTPLTGHLLEEVAAEHRYSGTLDFLGELLVNRKIIAVFTSAFFVREQIEVLKYLDGYLDKHPDVVVLIRRHRADTRPLGIKNDRMRILPDYRSEEMNITLFDLLVRASVSISFASTVSIQATWFGTPSISYEITSQSRLPFKRNSYFYHINTVEQLGVKLDEFTSVSSVDKTPVKVLPASDNIAAILTQSQP
jgi:hypothetical protein